MNNNQCGFVSCVIIKYRRMKYFKCPTYQPAFSYHFRYHGLPDVWLRLIFWEYFLNVHKKTRSIYKILHVTVYLLIASGRWRKSFVMFFSSPISFSPFYTWRKLFKKPQMVQIRIFPGNRASSETPGSFCGQIMGPKCRHGLTPWCTKD